MTDAEKEAQAAKAEKLMTTCKELLDIEVVLHPYNEDTLFCEIPLDVAIKQMTGGPLRDMLDTDFSELWCGGFIGTIFGIKLRIAEFDLWKYVEAVAREVPAAMPFRQNPTWKGEPTIHVLESTIPQLRFNSKYAGLWDPCTVEEDWNSGYLGTFLGVHLYTEAFSLTPSPAFKQLTNARLNQPTGGVFMYAMEPGARVWCEEGGKIEHVSFRTGAGMETQVVLSEISREFNVGDVEVPMNTGRPYGTREIPRAIEAYREKHGHNPYAAIVLTGVYAYAYLGDEAVDDTDREGEPRGSTHPGPIGNMRGSCLLLADCPVSYQTPTPA